MRNKKLAIINLVIFALGTLLPTQAIFASFNALPENSQNQNFLSAPEFIVKVIQPSSLAKIITPNETGLQATFASSCLGNSVQQLGLIQDTGGFNLNVPANCFSLRVARLANANFDLRVINTAKASLNIIVVDYRQFVASPGLAPAPFSQSLPVLPLVSWALLISFLTFERRITTKVDGYLKSFKIVIVPQQLQVLRC